MAGDILEKVNFDMKLSKIKYEKGQSKQDVLNSMSEKQIENGRNFQPANTPDLSLFTNDKEIGSLTNYRSILLWAGCLINHGRILDNRIDHLLSNVIIAESAFYSSKKPIQCIFDVLLSSRESIRNFETDVEEFMNIAGIIDHSQNLNAVNVVSNMLNQINSTYSRVFDLCILKLSSISNSRVTCTNILISSTALFIALLSYLSQS